MATDELLRSVKLSGKDWRGLVGLLVAALLFISGITYAMASHVVETKAKEIQESAFRITKLESKMEVVTVNLENYNKQQAEIAKDVREGNAKVNEIALSVARIEGRLTAPVLTNGK